MKGIWVMFLMLAVSSCSHKLAYQLGQEAENKRCMDQSVNEQKLSCRDDDQSYERYKEQREKMLESEDM